MEIGFYENRVVNFYDYFILILLPLYLVLGLGVTLFNHEVREVWHKVSKAIITDLIQIVPFVQDFEPFAVKNNFLSISTSGIL